MNGKELDRDIVERFNAFYESRYDGTDQERDEMYGEILNQTSRGQEIYSQLEFFCAMQNARLASSEASTITKSIKLEKIPYNN